ncbi:MAG: hypothetical protein R6W76_07230 [Caldilinea sp.]
MMDASLAWGSVGFGMVVGWITYYTMRKNTKERALADITVIIIALVGPAVLAVFPAPVEATKQTMFGYYSIGLAAGFFLYYIVFMLLLWKAPERLLKAMFVTEIRREDGTVESVQDTGNVMSDDQSNNRE